ncbi:MAG TPA: RNA polymerase sigma factor [Kofleriaceae bacterium]|nr:RNA polymerase sigma factor [Kofleriaceae bacterium]
MATKLDKERLRGLIEPHWRRLYNFVFRLTLDRERAERYVAEIFTSAAGQLDSRPPGDVDAAEVWLLAIANQMLDERLPRQPEVNFDILDETLRSEATRTDVVRSLTDPQRDFLLWEMKQGCMTSVINCLPPGERAAFVVCHVLKLADEPAAKSLGITESAYKVRLSRARKKVGDYLAPRCEHVNPMNPCRCPARVGTALAKGFIKPLAPIVGPVAGEVSLRRPAAIPYGRYGTGVGNDDAPMRDIAAIYGSLPEPDPPPDLGTRLVDQLAR